MGVITNIIDAIRRIGSPTQRSALRRQDAYLAGKIFRNHRREMSRSRSGATESFVATIEPEPETVRPFSEEENQAIEENSALFPEFLRLFVGQSLETWGLDDLDAAFASWAGAADRRGYDEEAVVQILGAAFGLYCARTLDMRWVVITDPNGSAAALRGAKRDYRAFPFHAIWKRLRDREQGFFKPIYISLERAASEDWRDVDRDPRQKED
jgi:uncharacterized protein DUF3806